MRVRGNRLICDAEMTPDGAIIVIEDAGAQGVSGSHVHSGTRTVGRLPQRALWVHTMTADECITVGRLVRVRVFVGENRCGLGELAFDGLLAVASGVLAIGDAYDPGRRLLSGPPVVVRVSVLVANEIDVIDFGDGSGAVYPVSGPSEVNVLLHDDPIFADAICDTAPRSRFRWRWGARRARSFGFSRSAPLAHGAGRAADKLRCSRV